MGEPMTEAEARARDVLWYHVSDNDTVPKCNRAVDHILASTDALAVLLDWHELGKRASADDVARFLAGAEESGKHPRAIPEAAGVYRWVVSIVPDEEGATRE